MRARYEISAAFHVISAHTPSSAGSLATFLFVLRDVVTHSALLMCRADISSVEIGFALSIQWAIGECGAL